MEASNPIIYGLETQARALAPQLASNNEICFFIATQTLKPQNQVHLIEIDKSCTSLKQKVYAHPLGEVWKLNSSPHDPQLISSCFSSLSNSQVNMKAALLTLPEAVDNNDKKDFSTFANTEILDTEKFGTEIKTTEFHPEDKNLLATVIDNKVLLHERSPSDTRVIAEINAKNAPKFSTGKWSHHQHGNLFLALHDCGVRAYDIRDSKQPVWTIDEAHGQLIRDLDCNPIKQCHFVTGGDDGTLKVWDSRNTKEALFMRSDHQHWIWSVRFNVFYDQLILSSGSDCKVLLTSAASVSSEAGNEDGKTQLKDGLLHCYDQHEDSIYCVEWSHVDPWIFASLSYDGRVCISKVPKEVRSKLKKN